MSQQPIDKDDAEAAEREKRFFAFRIKDSQPHILRRSYQETFLEYHVFASPQALDAVEQGEHNVYCRKCLKVSRQGMVFAYQLFVRTEKDQLGVFKGMKHIQCHRCGFEEYYPMRDDDAPGPFNFDEHAEFMARQKYANAFNQAQQAAMAQSLANAQAQAHAYAQQNAAAQNAYGYPTLRLQTLMAAPEATEDQRSAMDKFRNFLRK